MYTGLTGSLKIQKGLFGNYESIAYISGWSIDNSSEIVKTTKLGKINNHAFPSSQSWSASADGAAVFETAYGQAELFKAKQKGDKVGFKFYLNDETNKPDGKSTYFAGEGYIESMSVDLSAEDKANISISVTGDGPLELIVDGEQENSYSLFQMEVGGEDGCLYITPDDNCPYDFKIENGSLIISTRR